MPTKCSIFHCNHPSIAKDLCAMHYKRQYRHGSIEQTRPNDWGAREKHPAYKAWCGLRRYHRFDMDPKWVDDFWAFSNAIPNKPSEEAKAFRIDKSIPWSTDNFYWREPVLSKEDRKTRADYMRNWQKHAREKNKSYFKSADLKKSYGVDIDWYERKYKEQNGACAVCLEPEKAKIKGRPFQLAVDHCHATGKVRSLLCSACNTAIGSFKDDPNLLRKAAEYLERHTSAPEKNGA